MKKLLLVFILFMSVGLFAGCGSTSGSSYVNTEISSIYITMNYNENDWVDAGVDTTVEIADARASVESAGQEYMTQVTKKYRNILTQLNADGVLDDNEKIIYKNHLNIYSGWNENNYVIEFRFYSNTSARIFTKYGGEFEKIENVDNFFATKTIENYRNLLSSTPDDIIETTVSDYFNSALKNWTKTNINEQGAEKLDDMKVYFMFLTTNSRLHSNGSIHETSDGFVHVFEYNNEIEEFSFYTVAANRYAWYLFALTLAMVVIAILLIVAYYKKPKGGYANEDYLTDEVLDVDAFLEDFRKKNNIPNDDEE